MTGPITTLRACIVAALVVFPLAWGSASATTPLSFVVVVNKSNPAASLAVGDLQRFFRKQTRMWPHGEAVVPVDWDGTTEIRQEFSKRVLNRSVREMGEFWVQQNITQGLTPPSTLKSSRAILRFVASVPGAIAYLPPADLDDTVRTLDIKGLR